MKFAHQANSGGSRRRPSRIWRVLRWVVILLLVIAAFAVLAVSTAPGGRLIALTINRLGSGPEQSVEIDSISGVLSGSTRIGHVLVSDATGEPWLLIKGIRIDWSPLALLSAGLAIDDLEIERVELARLPKAGEAASEQSTALQLPLAVDIKRFRASEILLGEPVAGRLAEFEASGALRVDAAISTALADLTITRTDGVGGQFSIDADYLEAEDRFNISANLSEPAGGVAAHLLDLSKEDAVSLSATSQGSLADWRLSLDGSINDETVASLIGRVVRGESGDAVSIEAEGGFGRFAPPALAQMLEGRSELLLEAMVEPDRSGAVIDIFTFASAQVSAEGRGRIAREGQVDLSVSLSPRQDAGLLHFGEGDGRISLSTPDAQLRVSGDAEEAAMRLVASIDLIRGAEFSADEVSAVVNFDQFSFATRSGVGQVDAEIAAVGSANDMLARAVAGGVRLSGDVALGDDGAIFSEQIRLASGASELLLKQLSYDQDGALQVQASGTMRSAVLSGQASGLLGDQLAFSATTSRETGGAFAVEDFEVSADHASASGAVTLAADGAISAELQARLANLAGLSDGVSGALQLDAKVAGSTAAPAFEAQLRGEALRVQGRDLSDLRLKAEGVADPASPRADIALSGELDGQPINGTVNLTQSDGVIRIDPLRFEVASNLITGSLTLDEANRPLGTIDFDLGDIGSLSALALQDISGTGGGRMRFDVIDGRSVADIALAFPSLSSDAFAINDTRIDLLVDDLFGAPKPEGTLEIASARAGETDVSGLRLGFSQAEDWTMFDGKARAAGLPVTIDGRVRPTDSGAELELAAGQVVFQGLLIGLSGPARAVIADGVTRIERLVISPGGGAVAVTGTAGEQLDLNVTITNVPLSAVNAVSPGAGLSGDVSGRLVVSGASSAPVVNYTLTGNRVRAAAASSVADVALTISADGALRDGRLAVNTRASGGGLAFTATGGVETGGTRQISLDIDGTAPFSLVSAPLAAQGLALSGGVRLNLSVNGPAASPRIAGTISTADARLVDGRSGIAINNLAADIGLTPGQATIRALSGELSSGGRISGSGTIGLEPGSGYPADLKLGVERGRYADGQMVATRFNADLSLSGRLLQLPQLGGVVRLDETTISIPDTLPASISQLDVSHKNAPAAIEAQSERLSPQSGSSTSGGLGLDLTVQATRIYVRGRGLDAELGGSVRLTGTTASPRAAGGFDLARGRLSILGKRLDFNRGKIGFAGSLIPVLDFAASSQAGSSTATVLVTGPANRPEFSFTSSPEMPEDEVMALLIFGRSLNDLSAVQIAQLAQAAGQLTGVVSGGGLVEQLRRATGVDDIDVRTDEDTGETSVGVGKYLNDRTYFGLESGGSAGAGKARIDLDIGRGIKLRGEADSSGETKGGIFFEREY